MIETINLQNRINDALDLIDNNLKFITNPETKQRNIILDSVTIFKLVKILGDEDD
nr:MAG TPA: hypothetical protein [Caudoviricetes sp.]